MGVFFCPYKSEDWFFGIIYPKAYKNALEANFGAYRALILSYIEGFFDFA